MKQSSGTPPIASIGSLFFSADQNHSPTGTAQHANQLSPISHPSTKKVCFFQRVKVILIPERQEFRDANIDHLIWTTPDEINRSLKEKIDMITSKYPHLSRKEAYKQLNLYDEETDQTTEFPQPGI